MEMGVVVSLRTVERAVAQLRQELRPKHGRRCVSRRLREAAPDRLRPAARRDRRRPEAVSFFVATLGYSRRVHVRAFPGGRQEHWFDGMESAFAAFGGVPAEVLLDNARVLMT